MLTLAVQHEKLASMWANSEDSTDHLVLSNLWGRQRRFAFGFLSLGFLSLGFLSLDFLVYLLGLMGLFRDRECCLWKTLMRTMIDAVIETCSNEELEAEAPRSSFWGCTLHLLH